MKMFKKLLLWAGIVAGLHAGEDLEIVLKNNTGKTLVIQDVKEYYSNLSGSDVGKNIEIEPEELFSFKINILLGRYSAHINENTLLDGVKFKVLDSRENDDECFEILWRKKDVLNTTSLNFYKLKEEKITETKSQFTLDLK